MNPEVKIDKIEQALIDSAIRIIKEGEGCLYVIKHDNISLDCEPLISNDLQKPFSIFDSTNQKRMDILAKTDGACIVDKDGMFIAYGMHINKTKVFKGWGCRHAAAYTASLKGNICILGSQESKKIKIFKGGKLIMQIDALEKGIEKKTHEAVNILSSIGVGSLTSLGVAAIAPALAIAIVPGILVFGGTHYLVKLLKNKK